jgi:hypothetical protein
MTKDEYIDEYSESYHAFWGSVKDLKAVCENMGQKYIQFICIDHVLFLCHCKP